MTQFFVNCQKCEHYYISKKEISQCVKCTYKKNEGKGLPNWIKYDKDEKRYVVIDTLE